MEPIIAIFVVFSSIVAIFYLFVTTRHKERMSLIDKELSSDLLYPNNRKTKPVLKVLLVNFALLLIGVGLGIFIGGAFHQYAGMNEEIAMPGTIFTMAGLGLFIGYKISSKLD
ncbi:MAG: hypothetical protein JXR19_05905 [Bacteroidia bacterium]